MIAQNVSVIVPTYKSLDFLKRTIHSLENQNIGSSQFEVIVIDDGSKDQTESWLVNYIGSLNLIPVIFKNNKGRSCARNAGVERASNPILIFLDGDMEVQPDWLQSLLFYFKSPDIVAVMGDNVMPLDMEPILVEKYYFSRLRGARQLMDGDWIPRRFMLFGNVMIRKKILIKIIL